MKKIKKNSSNLNQNQKPQPSLSYKYSDVMRFLDDLLISEGLITKEQLMKAQEPTKQENTKEVMFLRRSKNQ